MRAEVRTQTLRSIRKRARKKPGATSVQYAPPVLSERKGNVSGSFIVLRTAVSLLVFAAIAVALPSTAGAAVASAPVSKVTVTTGDTGEIVAGATRQYTATATYVGGGTGDVTLDAVWSSSRTSVASVDAAGVALGNLPGSTAIKATYGGKTSNSVTLIVSKCTILGTAGDETLTGTAGADHICGGGGNDILNGLDGADTLDGGAGTDTLNGGVGVDKLFGGTENDGLDGGADIDHLYGGTGDDLLIGGTGGDQLFGEAGDDDLYGHADNDRLSGAAGADELFGEDGNDRLLPGADDDLSHGNDGRDTVDYSDVPGPVVVDLAAASDQGTGAGTDQIASIEDAAGSPGDDTLMALASGSNLTGNAGADTLLGAAGIDNLRGNAGDDALTGNGGNDLLYGDAGLDTLNGSDGNDRLSGGADDDNLGGDADDDQLFGDDGADTLSAGTGNDRVTGGAGDDDADGGDGTDIALYDTAPTGVTADLTTGIASGGAGKDVLAGFENLSGSHFDDALTGDAMANTLTGLAGNDAIHGEGGADNLYGNAGDDDMHGGTENDYMLGHEGNDTMSGDDGDDSMDAGAGDDSLLGGAGNDGLVGDAGVDSLEGGDDDDSLNPGLGDDALIDGGAGSDSLRYSFNLSSVTIDLADGTSTGGGGNDAFSNIESATGTGSDDFLFGDGNDNFLGGGGGNDTIDGRGGDDTLDGGSGDDGIRGGTGTDTINGGAGTDTCDQAGCELSYNLPPVLTIVNASNVFTEGDAAKAVDSGLTLTDDSAVLTGATVTIDSGFESGKDVLSATPNGLTLNYAGSTLTISGNAAPSVYETVLRSVKFDNTSQDPSTTARTISFSVTDGEFTDGTGNDVSMEVRRINDAPIATAETYANGQRGVRMRVGTSNTDAHETEHTGNVLENDTDVDTPFANLDVAPGNLTSADCAVICPGNVVMASNGTFTYDPPAGDDGSDTFTYTLRDNDTGDHGGTAQTHTATVTLNRSGDRVWFVDDSAAAGGRGVSHSPLQSLGHANLTGASDKDGTGDRIFVYTGTYTNGIELETDQKLIGEPNGLNVGGTQFVAAGGSKPAISASGNGVTVASGTEVQDLALGNTPAASYSLHAPAGAGAFTVADTDIANGNGGALHIADGTPAVALGTLSSTGSSNNGVRIAETEGGTVSSTGGTLQNASAADFATSNSNTNVTLGSVITDDVGQLVNVSGGSGDVRYNGVITDWEDGDGDGIAITGTSGDQDFANQLLLSTNSTGAPAFSMTSSPSAFLQVDPAAASTSRLASSGHAALRVTDTKIHTDGLEFQKIGTTGTFGDRDGIELSNTGHDTAAFGRLVVTGTGPADSGGMILGRRNGIAVTNSNGPSLQDMKLSGHSDFAIRGVTVRGFNMDDTVIDGSVNNAAGQAFNGTDPNTDEGAVSFDNLTGTGLTISDSTIARGIYNGLRVVNSSGTLNRLTVTNTAFNSGATQPNGNDNVLIEALSNASLNATISGSTFTNVRGDHIDTGHGGTSSGDVQILNNTMSTTLAQSEILGGGINVDASGSGDITYAVNGNTVTGSTATAIVTGKLFGGSPGDATAVGTITGNTVGASGVAGSGSNAGSAIDVSVLGNGKHTVQVTNNQLRQYGQHGILATAGGASRSVTGLAHNAVFNLHVTGNTIEQPFNAAASSSGFQLIAGTNSGEPTGSVPDDYNVCLNLSGNNANNSGEDDASSARRDYVIRQRFETQVQLPGWTGPTSGDSITMGNAMASYLTSTGRAAAGFSNFTSAETASYSQSLPPKGFYSVGSCPTN